MEGILVSICCITYNHKKFIAEAINGFLAQKLLFNFEIIIADDASTDGTTEIIREYQLAHPSLIKAFLHEQNKGMMENFLFSLNSCKGKYIALCEGDDYWIDENKLSRQINFLENNPEYIMSTENSLIDNENTQEQYPFSNVNSRELVLMDIIDTRKFCTASVVYRRVDLPKKQMKGFMDTNLWCYLSKMGKIDYNDKISSVYRRHEGGITKISNRLKWIKLIKHSTKTLKLFHPDLELGMLFERNVREYKNGKNYYLNKGQYFSYIFCQFYFLIYFIKFKLFKSI